MEKQLLYLLDYNLRVEEADLIEQLRSFWDASTTPQSLADRRFRATPKPIIVTNSVPAGLETPPLTPLTPAKLQVNIPSSSKSTFTAPKPLPTPESPKSFQGQQAAWTSRTSFRGRSIFEPTTSTSPLALTTLNLHLEAPTPGLARRGSCDSQASLSSSASSNNNTPAESWGPAPGTIVTSTSTGSLRVSPPGLPRKASYTEQPNTIRIVSGESETTSTSPREFLKRLVVRQPTSLRTVRKAIQV